MSDPVVGRIEQLNDVPPSGQFFGEPMIGITVKQYDEFVAMRKQLLTLRVLGENRPKIVCLCGSTRFWRDFQRASLSETMQGRIVLSIGAASGTDDEHFGNLPREEYDRVKQMLDELHKRKIDLADEILVLNVDGYIGDSTKSEVQYAIANSKLIRWLEPDKAWDPAKSEPEGEK